MAKVRFEDSVNTIGFRKNEEIVEISKERYNDMYNSMPPTDQGDGWFLSGETYGKTIFKGSDAPTFGLFFGHGGKCYAARPIPALKPSKDIEDWVHHLIACFIFE